MLSHDDLVHYQGIVASLGETIRLMQEIDAAIPGWPFPSADVESKPAPIAAEATPEYGRSVPGPSDDDNPDEAARRERNRGGFANAAGMTFGLLKPEMVAVEGGWRDARMLDGDFTGWLCPHVHATAQEAMDCPEQESLLGRRGD